MTTIIAAALELTIAPLMPDTREQGTVVDDGKGSKHSTPDSMGIITVKLSRPPHNPLSLLQLSSIYAEPTPQMGDLAEVITAVEVSPPLQDSNVHIYAEIFWYLLQCAGTTPLHALVIGINKYANVKQLKGCVADADAVEEFLRDDLKVPQDQIISLRDEEASRSAMVQAFRHLANHPKIQMDDPILIFFAGHGSELPAPPEWEAGGLDSKIQGLIPQDYDNKNLPLVHVIPDRTVGALINEISRKKGNNITIIFDCCHSGSGTRKDESSAQRTVNLPDNVPADLDLDLWQENRPRGITSAPGSSYQGLDSHVLLAACGEKETAYEDGAPRRGLFTTALLKLLREEGVDKLIYNDVLKRIDVIPNQNPQCQGTNSNRIFFTGKCAPARRLTYPVRYEDGEYKMGAGAAHGISAGAEFDVYANEQTVLASGPILGSLIVGDVAGAKVFETAMTLPSDHTSFAVGDSAVALQTKLGEKEDYPLHVPLHEDFFTVFQALANEMKTPGSDTAKIKLVEDSGQAMLAIVKEGGNFYFNILDKRVTVHGVNRIYLSFDPDPVVIRPALRAAAHYYWHLNRNSTDHHFQDGIKVEFFELLESETDLDDNGYGVLGPYPNPENLYKCGAIKFTVKTDSLYGMKITNNTKWDLYPGVFYFDNSDLSIVPYYFMPPSGHFKTDSPLKKDGGTFTIGYGSTATKPRRFAFRPGHNEDVDVGFLKMFFTT
ncbi:hypothetical protein FIBSPDRAFT_922853 [Athelia psychrophila]|uniref:Peptidase C14 caspase domain-containing protein n=1 Tax=Athelia psychrophila TaxID=1759441 RepID=A0A167XP48_9AGAM|nr:hypothetical protein FIBSPDRAFT_922853 [Fibularhizoctonia sp. CBS 109695]